MSILTEAFENCPLPLYLNLCFEKAMQWASYHTVTLTSLKKTIEEAIAEIFDRVGKKHGVLLTSHILAYITASEWKGF